MSMPEPTSFTLVFEGNIKKVKGNPMATETVYGIPFAVGIGNAFEEADQLREVLRQIADMDGVPWRVTEFARYASTKVWSR